MIIVIGGTSCVGKTNLAAMLMKRYAIPYFSVDHLMMGLYRSDSKCGFTPESTIDKISRNIWPIIYEMIKTNIENDNSFIYEGVQILPEKIKEMDTSYLTSVVPVFICLSEKYILKNYQIIKGKRDVVEKRTDSIESIDKMIQLNNGMIEKCEKKHIEPCIIKGKYLEEVEEIMKRIDLTIASTLTTRPDTQSASLINVADCAPGSGCR